MGNRRLSLTALALAVIVVGAWAAPAFAQNGLVSGGPGAIAGPVPDPQAATGIGINAGWSSTSTVPPAFFWSGTIPVFSTDGPFTFTLTSDGCVSVTDDFAPGDQFRIYDNGTGAGDAIGDTPVVATGGPDVDNGPDVAYFDPTYSSATFLVGAGSHSISIEAIGVSLSGGRGYIRVDTAGSFTPCDNLLGPDLVINSITHSPASPDTEDNIEFTAVVKNVGFQTAGASTLSFKIGGESPSDPDALFSIGSLAPGASETVIRNEGLIAQGYINTAVADFNDEVDEVDEGNNTATDNYTVTQAEEPSGVVYSLLTAPTDGDLYEEVDGAGVPVGSALTDGSTILDPESLHYFPNPGFEGTDMFTYRCTDTATGLFDDATVDIIVSSPGGTGVTLTIDFLGSGSGDVTMDVGGSVVAICGADCTENFGPGDVVKLQARPIDEFSFGGWGGDCAAGGSSQIFTITLPSTVPSSRTCTVTFNP